MDKRSRAWKLYKLGIEHWNDFPEGKQLVYAMAVMIDAATSKEKSKKPLHDPEAVAFLDTLVQVAGDMVDAEPFDLKWYKLAEWRLRELPHVKVDDAYVIGEYLANGGWKGGTPTVQQVLNYLPDLLKKAEESGTYDPRFNV